MRHKFESYYLDYPLVTGRIFDVFEPEEITKDNPDSRIQIYVS